MGFKLPLKSKGESHKGSEYPEELLAVCVAHFPTL